MTAKLIDRSYGWAAHVRDVETLPGYAGEEFVVFCRWDNDTVTIMSRQEFNREHGEDWVPPPLPPVPVIRFAKP